MPHRSSTILSQEETRYSLLNRERVIHACRALSADTVFSEHRYDHDLSGLVQKLIDQARPNPRYQGYAGWTDQPDRNPNQDHMIYLQFGPIRTRISYRTIAKRILEALREQGLNGTWTGHTKDTIAVDLRQAVQTSAPRLVSPRPMSIPTVTPGPHRSPYIGLEPAEAWLNLPRDLAIQLAAIQELEDPIATLAQLERVIIEHRDHPLPLRANLETQLACLEHWLDRQDRAHDRMAKLEREARKQYGARHRYTFYTKLLHVMFLYLSCSPEAGVDQYHQTTWAKPSVPLYDQFWQHTLIQMIHESDPWTTWYVREFAWELVSRQREHCEGDCLCVADATVAYATIQHAYAEYDDTIPSLLNALAHHLKTIGPEALNTRRIYGFLASVMLMQHRDRDALMLLQASTSTGGSLSDSLPGDCHLPRWSHDRTAVDHDLACYRGQIRNITIDQLLKQADVALRLRDLPIAAQSLGEARTLLHAVQEPAPWWAIPLAMLEAELGTRDGSSHATILHALERAVQDYMEYYVLPQRADETDDFLRAFRNFLDESGTPTIRSRFCNFVPHAPHTKVHVHPDDRAHTRYRLPSLFEDDHA